MTKHLDQLWAKKPITRLHINVFARRTMRYLRKGQSLLDLGCGYGIDSLFFARKGVKVTALDFSSSSVAYLQEHLTKDTEKNVTVMQHDLSKKLPFPDNSFDAVYAHLSIHYFDDATTQKIVDEVRRVLKPRGLFFVKCKSVDDALYGKGKKVGEDMFLEEYVRHFFRKDFMASLLSKWDIVMLRKATSLYVDYASKFIEAIARKTK